MRLAPEEVRTIEKLRAMPEGKVVVVKDKGRIRDIQVQPKTSPHKCVLTKSTITT